MSATRIIRGRMVEDEWLTLEGHEQRLAGLARERYAITRGEADRQARSLFENQKS